MPLPAPIPGPVIRCSYLWHSEHLAGREEGQKDRPCAIVAAIRPAEDAGETRVLVLPATHTPPTDAALAVEIPARQGAPAARHRAIVGRAVRVERIHLAGAGRAARA